MQKQMLKRLGEAFQKKMTGTKTEETTKGPMKRKPANRVGMRKDSDQNIKFEQSMDGSDDSPLPCKVDAKQYQSI